MLLEIGRFRGSVNASVNVFDREGWEERSERLSWTEEPGMRVRDYRRKGGRDSVAEAIADAANLSREEADSIAEDSLRSWQSHIDEDEAADMERTQRVVYALVALVAFCVVGFFALLIVVVVMLVF